MPISESFPTGLSPEAQKRFEIDKALREPRANSNGLSDPPTHSCTCEKAEFTVDFERGIYCLACMGAPNQKQYRMLGYLWGASEVSHMAAEGWIDRMADIAAALDPTYTPFVKFSVTVDKAAALIPSDMRPSFEWVWMQTAKLVRMRGTCPRLKVGAVLVKDNEIIATGYNGAPKTLHHCSVVGCDIEEETGRCKRTVHAEANVILQSSPERRKDSILYVTAFPCVECCALIANSGIKRILYLGEYETQRDKKQKMVDILTFQGVEVIKWLETRE
jgi:dCMP deaminase